MEFWESFAAVIGGAWLFFKTASFIYFKHNADLERLFEALEIGVHKAWITAVKPWLEKNEPGVSLPPAVRDHAERIAIEEAARINPKIKRFPKSVISATLKMAVEEAKRRGGK